MLDAVKKKIKLEHIHRAFDLCESHGMRTFANLLLNLPGETENDIDLSHALLKRIRPTYTSIGLTQPYPGTPIYRTLGRRIDKKDYHLLDREFPPEEFRLCSHQLNLKKLLYEWQMKYKTFTPFETSMIKADVRYWWKIFASKHRLGYLIFLLKEFSIQPIRYLRAKYNRPSRWAAEGD
jgi:radical SAM superfamily enzyme YgiQ (UPF0313 family)